VQAEVGVSRDAVSSSSQISDVVSNSEVKAAYGLFAECTTGFIVHHAIMAHYRAAIRDRNQHETWGRLWFSFGRRTASNYTEHTTWTASVLTKPSPQP